MIAQGFLGVRVVEQANQGQLSTPHLEPNFVVDSALVEKLLRLLEELASASEV
jgi:hypothetical protein